jgi:hypothetical protein
MSVLMPHQERAVEEARVILAKNKVVYLALDCRVGKSMAGLTLANGLKSDSKAGILVLTRKKAIESILGDAKALGLDSEDLVVTNYESAHKVDHGRFGAVILDECHSLSGYPKPGKAAKEARRLCLSANGIIMMSATPAIESGSQWFHQFWATGRGLGQGYAGFYKWFKDYGVPKKIRIAGGREVNDYSEVRQEVHDHVKKYCVTVTQEEAGFKVKPEVVVHRIEDDESVQMGKRICKHGILELGERVVVAENPAASQQKAAMICGGTVLDDEGGRFEFISEKASYLLNRVKDGRRLVVFTAWVAERDMLIRLLKEHGWRAGEDMEALERGELDVFVGSLKRYSEGVNLAWLTDGAMVLYSLSFSGATYHQVLNRMIRYDRVEPVKVHVLLVKDSVEEKIYNAVSQKRDYQARVYE